ncbi:MAG: diaminopimelate decarboxylase [Dehalococcoidia bacterium]
MASLFPETAHVDAAGHLHVGGCHLVSLAAEYGTPLYIYDEATIRGSCRAYLREFGTRLPGIRVLYAAKAFLNPALAAILAEEGMGLDVVSGGELFMARAGGFPAQRMAFHGNNKSEAELNEALDAGVGRIVVDNFHELELLDRLTSARGRRQPILLRVTPGVDAHTHAKTTTGIKDSKFGFSLETGAAETAVARALRAPGLELTGYHIHLGSPINDVAPYVRAIQVMAEFAAAMRDRYEFTWREFSPGGGFAVAYTADQLPPSSAAYAEAVADALRAACATHGLPLPEVQIEPGRSVVARAGVALYTVGARKEIADRRTYVAVDGGMADNVRPAMYGSRYTAAVANRMHAAADETVSVAGKFCESGDILIKDVRLPRLQPGDLLALPASGAYNLAMESNYNLAQRPAVLFVNDGRARLVRRRQSYEDLLALEVVPVAQP